MAHGLKEGCVSGPVIFLARYPVVCRRFSVEREAQGQSSGTTLHHRKDNVVEPHRERVLQKTLFPVGPTKVEIARLKESLFADDAALFGTISQAGCDEVKRLAKKRSAEAETGAAERKVVTTQQSSLACTAASSRGRERAKISTSGK